MWKATIDCALTDQAWGEVLVCLQELRSAAKKGNARCDVGWVTQQCIDWFRKHGFRVGEVLELDIDMVLQQDPIDWTSQNSI